jgi:valyl-tRNA synthetase
MISLKQSAFLGIFQNMDTTNNQEIPKNYNAEDWEEKLYALWEKSGFFQPDNFPSKKRYANILPPPNANGELHLGHTYGYTIMDIFGRFERMRGKQTLLLPGKDHAGIQTQVVFEKKLRAKKNLTRYDLGRDKFYEEAYAFCTDRANYMRSQEKRMGISADWSREKFTLDPEVSKRALQTFVQMYQDGMIYRGKRIINWCPRCATALSDVEVIHQEIAGKLYYIEYPFKDSAEKITVATTRPETMLGDTAVAVHPDDERYQAFVGKILILPLLNREIPVIADERVDQSFGTGAVKITPAHDPLDWEVGQTHSLPVIQVIGANAKIMASGGKFKNLSVQEAREAVLSELEKNGYLKKEEIYTINRSLCERCKTAIEPLISEQWFVNVDASQYSLKKKSVEALQSDAIIFHPENMRGQMMRWLDNLHDWCISRQIWWGHRIPVWYCRAHDKGQCQLGCKNPIVSVEAPLHCPICGSADLVQDPDTLDTWFSSGQWPYTTLGYPEGKDAQTFYPTDTMIMGRDLLFFWASRMVMFGLYRTGKVPFRHLYFTGLVRDKEGQKMSKSRDNGIDPLAMIDKYGADALRMSLVIGSTPGNDIRLYDEKIKTFRNFTNKLWNIGRYINNSKFQISNFKKIDVRNPSDHWIISRLQEITKEVTRLLENYQPSLAGEKLRDFTWSEFADWYVEIHKIEKNDGVLIYVFETLLKLWHPFMPFVTEAIYQTFHPDTEKLLMTERWPEAIDIEIKSDKAQRFQYIIGIIQEIRALRSFYKIDPVKYTSVTIKEGENEQILSKDNGDIFKRLARVSDIHIIKLSDTIPAKCIRIHFEMLEAYIELEYIIDFDTERKRLEKEKIEKEQYVTTLETKLVNQKFLERAKPEIVQAEQIRLEEAKKQLGDLEHHFSLLK